MKFEKYAQLSPELQKEYDWRFKNKQFNVNIGIVNLIIMWAFMTLCIMTVYAIAISPNHLNMPFNKMMEMFSFAVTITQAIAFVYVVEVLFYFGYTIYKFVEENKWRKENNIEWG